jgi:hypothetical protein
LNEALPAKNPPKTFDGVNANGDKGKLKFSDRQRADRRFELIRFRATGS